MDIEKKIKRLIFSDSAITVDRYLRDNPGEFAASDTLFIAMNPTVFAHLRHKGLFVHNTLEYFDAGARLEALTRSKILVEWLERNVDFLNKGNGIGDAYKNWFIFLTRFAINYCLWTITIVSNAIEAHKPELVLASSSGARFTTSVYIEPEEEYLGHIVKLVSHKKGIIYDDVSTRAGSGDMGSYISTFGHLKLLVLYLLKYWAFRLWMKLTSVKDASSHRKGSPVLFTTRLYQMEKLARELMAQSDIRAHHFLRGPIIPSFAIPDYIIDLFWSGSSKIVHGERCGYEYVVKAIIDNPDLFFQGGIPFADVIAKKLHDNIAPYMIGKLLWSFNLSRIIDWLKPKAIVSNGDRPDDTLLAELCREKDITTIFISHGSSVLPKDEHEHIEWGEHGRAFLRGGFSFYALQSPLAEAYKDAFVPQSEAVKTGPLIWGRPIDLGRSRAVFEKLFGDRYDFDRTRVILHAGTPKSSNILRFHIYETPDEYIQSLSELAGVVEKLPGVVLIVKFRPTSEIRVEDLKALVDFSEKVVLSVGEGLIDVLGMSDLVVSFSSTAIEEALQNRIPVLLYGGHGRYQHVSAYEIKPGEPVHKKAVYHVKEAKHLEYALNGIFGHSVDIDDEDSHLFDPYIYSDKSKVPLASLLK